MKILRVIATLLLLASLCTVIASAESAHGWYIVKKRGGIPEFPADSTYLGEHSCYFIDKKSAESGEKVIYLTFDAGYENGNIERILDALKSEGVHAAFFVLSNLINKNTDLVCRMFDEGHCVCNHTQNHKTPARMSADEIKDDLGGLEALCLEKTGHEMSKYFRYPEGVYSKESVDSLEELGYKSFFWSAAYADWDNNKQPRCSDAIESLKAQTHPGAIILLHPTSSTNAEIIPQMITIWREMGYRFGTLDELVAHS